MRRWRGCSRCCRRRGVPPVPDATSGTIALAKELSRRYPPGTPCTCCLYPGSARRLPGTIRSAFSVWFRKAGLDVCVLVPETGGQVVAWALEVDGEALMPVAPWRRPAA